MQYRCMSCLRKHLSLCKSFGRQVVNGHGANAIPDHRIDVQGQLSNAQYHANVIDKKLTQKIRFFRRTLQNKKFILEENDLQILNIFYYYSYKFSGDSISEQLQKQYDQLQYADETSDITSNSLQKGCNCNKK